METKRSHDELVEILDRNSSWIENCDNKASIILGMIGVVAGIFLATDYVGKIYNIILHMTSKENLSFGSIVFLLILTLSVLGMIIGCLLLIKVLVPRYKIEEYKRRGINKESVIHYSSIAKHKSFTKYKNKLIRLSNEDMSEDIMEQIYVCAIICQKKFTAYKSGLYFCTVSFLIFVLMVTLGFVITK